MKRSKHPPSGEKSPSSEIGRLEVISIYPVKGLGGVDVASADVMPWGLAGDRLWCVVDEDGVFVSQRTHPLMASIRAEPADDQVVLSAPDGSSVVLPTPDAHATRTTIGIWKDRVEAAIGDENCNRWLSDRLSARCRLVRLTDPASDRPIRQPEGRPGESVSFADAFPILCTGTASLDWLRDVVSDPSVPMSRFRANIVVGTLEAWAEKDWRSIDIGDVVLEAVKPCRRCPVVDVDQVMGSVDQPNRLLSALSRGIEGRRTNPEFGMNLIPRKLGTLHLGDVVCAR